MIRNVIRGALIALASLAGVTAWTIRRLEQGNAAVCGTDDELETNRG